MKNKILTIIILSFLIFTGKSIASRLMEIDNSTHLLLIDAAAHYLVISEGSSNYDFPINENPSLIDPDIYLEDPNLSDPSLLSF